MGFEDARQHTGAVKPSAIEQEVYDANLSALRLTEIPSNLQMRLDYGGRSDSQPVYLGFGARGLATSDDGWLIYKFTYTADPGDVTLRQIAYDAWDDRDTTAVYA